MAAPYFFMHGNNYELYIITGSISMDFYKHKDDKRASILPKNFKKIYCIGLD
jgi:hypothetical protein